MKFVDASTIRSSLTWGAAIDALANGLKAAKPRAQDLLLADGEFSLFGRGVILAGHGAGVKIASIFPPNTLQTPPSSAEHALFAQISETTKKIEAIFGGPELTRWKTAATSALGSRMLSRQDSETLFVIGAGPVAAALIDAHLSVRPSIQNVLLWNRTPEKLKPIMDGLECAERNVVIVDDLRSAVASADIISSATSSREPLILGEWLKDGCHLDLVGGFTPQMREADDRAASRAMVYVDYLETAMNAGDICGPLTSGALQRSDICGDLTDLLAAPSGRQATEITMFKNAGGAHLDLLVAEAVLEAPT